MRANCWGLIVGRTTVLGVAAVPLVICLSTTACRRAAPPIAPTKSAVTPAPTNTVQPTEVSSKESITGGKLYAQHCAACHGEQGDGQGLAARYVFPKPRDFRAGKFRLVSTSNNVPSRADLHAVLLRGMPGSSMPPWSHLPQAQRDALVSEVMRLRGEGARESYVARLKTDDELTDEEISSVDVQAEIKDYLERVTVPGESSVVPDVPPVSDEALAKGRETYTTFNCVGCHGKEGKGDGGQPMVDGEGLPTRPRDFTAGIFKGGHDPASLYRRIAYGMPGTPMPSSQMTPEQVANLVHYLRSMSTEEQRQAATLNREKIVAKKVLSLPPAADERAWSAAPTSAIRMAPLWWRDGADPSLSIQAAHDGRSITLRITWRDETENRHALRSEAFEDAVAVELYRGEAEPFLGMGSAESPIDVWFWDADRQSPADVEDEYPNVVVDIYPFSEKNVSTPEFRREGTTLAAQPKLSLPALASGNQIAPGHAATGGSDLAVAGPGSVTFRIPKNQLVSAQGQWRDGRWTVVMQRSLTVPSGAPGIALEPGQRASLALAVWDGGHQDRDGKKLITIWQDLELEK